MDEKTLKYAKSHEWIEGSGATRKVGISHFAQDQLGDLVFVEFPADGQTLAAGEEACVIESCKATASVYAPVAGKIVAYNTGVADTPEKINDSPFDEGWLFEIEVEEEADDSALMDHAAYEAMCAEE